MKVPVKFILNGESRKMTIEPSKTLVDLIRDDLDLTGTKKGCGTGDCGACTVILDGKAVVSCFLHSK